jgi:inosine triphosphate pyrophosphatase
VFVTGNENKLKEVQSIVGESFDVIPFTVDCMWSSFFCVCCCLHRSHTHIHTDIIDPQYFTLPSNHCNMMHIVPELQGEPEDISREKCRLACAAVQKAFPNEEMIVVIEDTCLCFNALKGLPGPYIKWFLDKIGHVGLNNLLAAYEDKGACAMCVLSYALINAPLREIVTIVGKTEGRIVPARGDNSFGWDPIFQPDGFQETYAQLDKNIKNTISHRYKAFDALKKRLLESSTQ